MTLRPCIVCGEVASGPRCDVHTARKPAAAARGYDANWTRLSKRARRLQPFCTDCGSAEDLQADHTPEAWTRKAEGKAIRLADVCVVCGPCNRRRGAARGASVTRGDAPNGKARDPLPRQSLSVNS